MMNTVPISRAGLVRVAILSISKSMLLCVFPPRETHYYYYTTAVCYVWEGSGPLQSNSPLAGEIYPQVVRMWVNHSQSYRTQLC